MLEIEQGIPNFPAEYPDTPAGKRYAADRKKDLEEDYNKHPPAKRPSYKKLHISDPFEALWARILGLKEESGEEICVLRGERAMELLPNTATYSSSTSGGTLQWVPKKSETSLNFDSMSLAASVYSHSLVPVTLRMTQRGRPSELALICFPLDEDYQCWQKDHKWMLEEPHNAKRKNKKRNNTSQDGPFREIIGRVTTAGFSMVRGCGYAVGFCTASSVARLLRRPVAHPGLVLVRNTNSLFYKTAFLAIRE